MKPFGIRAAQKKLSFDVGLASWVPLRLLRHLVPSRDTLCLDIRETHVVTPLQLLPQLPPI